MAVKKRKSNKITILMQKKLLIVFGVVILLLIALSAKVIYINVNKGYDYSKQVYDNFSYDSRTIPARRGDITDRNGTVLAYSTKVYNLIIDSKIILSDEGYRQPTVDALLSNFDIDAEELNAFLDENADKKKNGERPSSYRRLLKGLEADDISNFNELMSKKDSKIKGVWFEEEYKRTYPFNSLACDLIGFASEANGGEIGIESYYEKYLAGTNGRVYGYINDNSYETGRKNAVNGNTVVSTIDYTVQNIIEGEIKSFNETYGSNAMAVVVMDPNTGEILGMADYPTFDLNNPRDMSGIYTDEYFNSLSDEEKVEKMYDVWSNYCISELYEPGSVFKPFTVAASMEENVCDPKDVFECDGEATVDGARILCNGGEGQGRLTLAGSLEESCNDCLIQISARLGKEKFLKYLDTYKFGNKTEIDLGGEEKGIVKSIEGYMDVDLATNSFGQNLNVTMVQMMSSFASLINGGYYYKPHTVKEIRTESGDVIEKFDPVLVTQTISTDTSKIIREMLRSVVDYGGGYLLRMDGYSIGGKTGTAEKVGRNKKNYVVSFMGFAPAENPQVLVYVVIDTPHCIPYDNSISAQYVSRNIYTKLFPYLGITPDYADYSCDIYYDADNLEATAVKQPYGPIVNPDPPQKLPEGFTFDDEEEGIRVNPQDNTEAETDTQAAEPPGAEETPPADIPQEGEQETPADNTDTAEETTGGIPEIPVEVPVQVETEPPPDGDAQETAGE